MFDAQETLVEVRVEPILVDGLHRFGVVVKTFGAEEVRAVDLETPLSEHNQACEYIK